MNDAVSARDINRLSAALFIWYLFTYVLLPVPPVALGIDESWRAFLTWAFQAHKQFGADVIFTYGPWGFLLDPRGTSAIYPWLILGRSVLALAASCGMALVSVSSIRDPVSRSLQAAAVVVLAEPTVLVPALLFVCSVSSRRTVRRRIPFLILIAFAAGLAACTKFTCFLLVAALLPLLAMRRYLAPVLATAIASFFLFWLLAAQQVSHLSAFVMRSLEVSSGYTSAMVAGRPRIELPLALLICGLPLIMWARQTLPPFNLENVARLCWLAGCEFLIFKHAITRADPIHYYMAFITEGLPLALLLSMFRRGVPNISLPVSRFAYAGLGLAALFASLWSSGKEISTRAGLFSESLRGYPAWSRALLRPAASVPPRSGTVDVFPYELSYAIEEGLALRNRPVIQAYSAYTGNLSERDAHFLEGPDAPDTIYFHAGSVDERYPSMEDSLAWRSLLTHYTASSIEDDYLALRHRERPGQYHLQPVLDRNIHTDETLVIPSVAGGLIWAELDAPPTATGRLLNLFYRNEKMDLRVKTDKKWLAFTLLDETAAVGFLLSPYVSDVASMRELYKPAPDRLDTQSVRAILVHRGVVAALGFSRDVRVRLYALTIN